MCAGTGFNAAGVVLMDEASGASSRSFADALLAGLFALGKAIVVMILAGLAFLAVVLAVALLLWICKIPVIGPVLFFIVFPLSAVTIGVLFVAFAFVLAPIASAAIWSGESIGTALARVAMVIRKRLVGVVVRACVLFVLLIVTAMVLWWIALSGTLTAGSLSLGIVGVDANLIEPDLDVRRRIRKWIFRGLWTYAARHATRDDIPGQQAGEAMALRCWWASA